LDHTDHEDQVDHQDHQEKLEFADLKVFQESKVWMDQVEATEDVAQPDHRENKEVVVPQVPTVPLESQELLDTTE
jgi:hypothetical protein